MANVGVAAIILILGVIGIFIWLFQLSVKAIKQSIGKEIQKIKQDLNEINVKLDNLSNK
jgi:beta-lactamase regulating signal transducer with metallopeptidase domain